MVCDGVCGYVLPVYVWLFAVVVVCLLPLHIVFVHLLAFICACACI